MRQAGPSYVMHWYDTSGKGQWYNAGNRTGDGDAMNGNAVMFDAVQGLILTVGGATSYQARRLFALTRPSVTLE